MVKEHECGERGIFSVCTNYTVCVLSPGTLVTPRRSSVWQAGYYNSPEKCPCPLAPRKSACSRAVHCWGCRGPSLLRGPVEPLEEAVPVELWPPGDGKQGLLYGTHCSSVLCALRLSSVRSMDPSLSWTCRWCSRGPDMGGRSNEDAFLSPGATTLPTLRAPCIRPWP